MVMTARRQTALYYARKRTRSLRAVPRLHQTGTIAQGDSTNAMFDVASLSSSISFATRIDLTASAGSLFSLGSDFDLSLTPTQLILTIGSNSYSIDRTFTGYWDLVLSFRPGDGEARLWNQNGLLSAPSGLAATWGSAGALLDAQGTLLRPLAIYTCQLPRHFAIGTPTSPDTGEIIDNLLFNATALNFMLGFPTPLFES